MADDDWGKGSLGAYGVGESVTVARPVPFDSSITLDDPLIDVVEPAPGTRIRQYELIRELGRGGMGVVYAARDTKLGRRVAIKFLHNATREVADRFLIEARATAQCNHDNIVIIHEVDEYGELPYMVLELVEGSSLRELMGPYEAGVRLPVSRVVELVLPVARALTRAHELGIVHRDLKPENVVVTHDGHVKVLDFGLAKVGPADILAPYNSRPKHLNLTEAGALVGTLPYMSPEQLGVDTIDHRTDLWALGVIMFEMLAGHHPIQPLSTEALFENLANDVPMCRVSSIVPEVPAELTDLIDRCLRKRKAARIASASELADALEQLLPNRHRRLAVDKNPFPGLTAFQENDADRFFGRARDITRMVARIRESPLTGIVGPSGVGKSSFVRAGIGPALKASGERWEIVPLRPGRQPIAALATVIERLGMLSTPRGKPAGTDHGELVGRLRTEPGYLGAVLRARARDSGGHILVFVDQLEELYTLVPDVSERRAFTAALCGVADDSATPLRVVVSMRSDLLDRMAEDARFMEDLTRGLVFLASPDTDGLREALVTPVEMVGYRYETMAMVDDMIAALANTPGALPLLQFAAVKLWDARDRERRLVTLASYHAIGGLTGALATHADEVVASMNAHVRVLAQQIFRRLVTPERTRAIVELVDLQQLAPNAADVTRTIDQLVAARLLVVRDGGSIELVHESLIDRWPMLRRWLDEDQGDAAFVAELGTAAKQWETRGRPAGLLWRGETLEEARRWYMHRPRSLAIRDRAFLDAALHLARRGRRIRSTALIGSFVLLGAIAAGAIVAYVHTRTLKQEAHEQAELAEKRLLEKTTAEAEQAVAKQHQSSAEDAKSRAEDAKSAAEGRTQMTLGQLRETADKLEQRKLQLETALRAAGAAKERAELLSAERKQAADDANAAKAKLAEALAVEKARVKQLEDEKKKISTKLKGE